MDHELPHVEFERARERFFEQHSDFLAAYPRATMAVRDALSSVEHVERLPEPIHKVVYWMGQQASEDFFEILVLCSHGFGIGATKVLRGMYERVVTQRYLSENPIEIQRFIDYGHVNKRKLVRRAVEVFGEDYMPTDTREEVEKQYQAVKDTFPNKWGWGANLAERAKTTTGTLDKVYLQCYQVPTLNAHATQSSIFARLGHDSVGNQRFDRDAQDKDIDTVISLSWWLLLEALDTLNRHFQLGRGETVKSLANDFARWSGSK